MSNQDVNISFELFPPKTEAGFEKMKNSVLELTKAQPEYFSVTYGAGGSTQDRTFESVDWLRESGLETAPHLSCIGTSRDEILEILKRYKDQGIHRLVALRGDLPSGSGLGGLGELGHANELVTLIREEFADDFRIEVAAYPEVHPQSANFEEEMKYFRQKVEAGADSAITQYFYNPDAYIRFVESCQAYDIKVPIIPGVMPITNYTQLARFSDACGAEIPRWLRKRLESFGDDLDSLREFGVDTVTRLCEQLIEAGAPGLHFYTMNQSAPSLKILQGLSLVD